MGLELIFLRIFSHLLKKRLFWDRKVKLLLLLHNKKKKGRKRHLRESFPLKIHLGAILFFKLKPKKL